MNKSQTTGFDLVKFKAFFTEKLSYISAETLGWMAVIVLHGATIPSLFAVMQGLTGTLPGIDMVLLMWAALTLLFVKAAVQKDMLNMVTISVGFIIQAVLIALIFFK